MSDPGTTRFSAEHGIDLPAGSAGVFGLLADVTRWPVLFGPCVHAEILERGPGTERVRMWAFTGEQVSSWISRRRLDPRARRLDFEQETSPPPFAAVGGHWRVDTSGGAQRLVLAHHWDLLDPTPQIAAWATEMEAHNSTAEIAAVQRWAQQGARSGPDQGPDHGPDQGPDHGSGQGSDDGADPSELVFAFSERLAIAAPAAEVYEFLLRSDLWPQRLPHVAGVDLETTAPTDAAGGAEVQSMRMRTRADDGGEHATHSVRLCFPHERIVYKQTSVPAPLLGHAGAWIITPAGEGVQVEARHTVALDPAALADPAGFFAAGTTAAQARATVSGLLGRNSLLTLEHARRHTERVSA